MIYVIDASDRRGFDNIVQDFNLLMSHKSLKTIPLVIALNKIDLLSSDPLTTDEVVRGLGLRGLGQRWVVQPTNAVAGDGLCEVFDWICKLKEIKSMNFNFLLA